MDESTRVFWQHMLTVIGLKAWAIAKIVIFFLLVRFIAYRLIDKVIATVIRRQSDEAGVTGRVKTLCGLIRSTFFYVLIFISGIMLLKVFDIDAAPVLTAAGVVGLAVGFGAQKLVRDIISGFFIVLENQYSVGDYVTIGAVTGIVEELGMRVTQLRDDMGKLVTIANGDITMVTNQSRGPIQAVLEVSVAPDSDLEKVRSSIDSAGADVALHVDGVVTPPKADGVSALDAAKMTIRVLGEVKPGRQDAVQSALRELIRQRFEKEGVKLV
jgi:small-conductance mechanosensitive channel